MANAGADGTIGNMNGRWALLLKVMLVAFPMFVTATLAWGTWVTSELMRSVYGPKFTRQDATHMELKFTRKLDAMDLRIDHLPSDPWQRRIEVLEANQRKLVDDMAVLRTEHKHQKELIRELRSELRAMQRGP